MHQGHGVHALHGGVDGGAHRSGGQQARAHFEQALDHLQIVFHSMVDFAEQHFLLAQVVRDDFRVGLRLFVFAAQFLYRVFQLSGAINDAKLEFGSPLFARIGKSFFFSPIASDADESVQGSGRIAHRGDDAAGPHERAVF